MDKIGIKFCFITFALFIFWYIVLYNYDWISFSHLSAISHSGGISGDRYNPDGNQVGPFYAPVGPFYAPDSDSIPDETAGTRFFPDDDEDLAVTTSGTSHPGNAAISHVENSPSNGVNVPTDDIAIPDIEKLQKEVELDKRRSRKPCTGRYIYMHNIPSRFNEDYLKQCKKMDKWQNMCPYFDNGGLGTQLGNPQKLFMSTGWYDTSQFSLAVIFHNIMKQYECLTKDSSKADAIYVPYYQGLDVARYLWDNYTSSVKDADALELLKWLREKPEWKAMGGKDHFMVSGRITWDMRRPRDDGNGWGSKLMLLPESRNMTTLTTESSPWDKNDFAIPYPTNFHPLKDREVFAWQRKMGRRKRRTLFCFAGEPRRLMENSIRGKIKKQCKAATRRRCRMIDCKDRKRNCLKPADLMKMFETSIFCLQPPGDSFTTRSTFDAIMAGCIPVFFTPGSAYVQYLWHLPKNFTSYSVLIPEIDVKEKNVSIARVLLQIPKDKVSAMREEVIKLIPNVIYSDPRARLENLDDAFDLAVKGIAQRVNRLRREMTTGWSDSDEFDPYSSWKYYTFATTQPHEWDHFFNKSLWPY